ncbi:L-type lectin-domain containing receptor kinase S.4 [Morus notabilis]|uniref:L-type lectin-domain containing receptor kinase S.4 n=1 Tax=Morus notabilis TaxID=981085 RepID=W9RVI5_9ROSA|nr:L-type lectin-domain containing receptor kinase S.4 [Morus notabilis]
MDDLLLVYDYIPNGSLDKLLCKNENPKKKLSWEQRYKILTDVAQALLYLHEECEQMVVHRDVKPSNIQIRCRSQCKTRGLWPGKSIRPWKQSGNNQHRRNTRLHGPELARTGKATTSTDVYGYTILLLEVVCGRRPIDPHKPAAELVLVDWVRQRHCQGDITRAVDPTLDDYESMMQMKLALCSVLAYSALIPIPTQGQA